MTGELFINGKDAYDEWGIFMDENSMAQLRTPPSLKPTVSNSSRLLHGAQYVRGQPIKIAERSVTLNLQFTARSDAEFNRKYEAFIQELLTGWLHITTYHQPSVEYKMRYTGCNQYSEFFGGIAKFVLKLSEPDPTDRELDLN